MYSYHIISLQHILLHGSQATGHFPTVSPPLILLLHILKFKKHHVILLFKQEHKDDYLFEWIESSQQMTDIN